MMRILALAFAAFFIATPAFALDGVNMDSGDLFTVDDATIFKVGDTVAVYDADGNETDLEVQAVKDTGAAFDVDFLDPELGETTTIEFTKPAPAAQ
jgi:hypothetical protein